MNTKNFVFLRGIAITLVLLFHLGIEFWKFGFIGVDIFFVLSSFLITKSILEKGYKNNNYLIYLEKRFFRIFPPLIAVITLSILFSYLLLHPDSLLFFCKSIIYTLFGSADLFFLKNINYFSPISYSIPSLHYWSLGIEIKFYIMIPLILLIINKKNLILLILFSIVTYLIFYDYNNSFFLFLLKLPHFIAGSLLYYFTNQNYFFYKYLNKNIFNYFYFIFFCFFIIFIMFNYNHPLTSLISIFLSIILILNSNSKIYKIFFCNFFFGYLGKLSYSIYLVHWPIIVFYTIYSRGAVNEMVKFQISEMIIIVFLIIFFSHLIFIFYEKKYINSKLKSLKSLQLYILIIFSLVFSIAVINKNGIWERLNIQLKEFSINYDDLNMKNEIQSRKITKNARSKFSDTTNNNILILGDSYGRDIYGSLLASGSYKFSRSKVDIKLHDTFSQYCFESLINKKFNKNIYIKFKCEKLIKQIKDNKNFEDANIIIISYRFGAFYKENWKENILSLKNIKNNKIFKNKKIIIINRRTEFYHFLHTDVMTKILLYKLWNTFPLIKKVNLESIFNKKYAKHEIEAVNKLLRESLFGSDIIYFDITELQKNLDENLIQFNNQGQSLYIDSISHFTMAGRLYFGNLILKSNLFTNLMSK